MKQNRLLKNTGLLIFSFLLFACTASKTANTSISEEDRIKEIIFGPDFEIRLDSASNIIRHQTDSMIHQLFEEHDIDEAALDQFTVPKIGDIIENDDDMDNAFKGLFAMMLNQLKGLRDIDIASSVRQDMKLFTFFTKYEQWQNIEENIKSYPISELKNTRQLDVTENKDSITVVVKSVYGQIELTNTFKLSNQADIDYIKVDEDVGLDIKTIYEEDGEKEFSDNDITTEYEIEKGVDDVDCRIIINKKLKDLTFDFYENENGDLKPLVPNLLQGYWHALRKCDDWCGFLIGETYLQFMYNLYEIVRIEQNENIISLFFKIDDEEADINIIINDKNKITIGFFGTPPHLLYKRYEIDPNIQLISENEYQNILPKKAYSNKSKNDFISLDKNILNYKNKAWTIKWLGEHKGSEHHALLQSKDEHILLQIHKDENGLRLIHNDEETIYTIN